MFNMTIAVIIKILILIQKTAKTNLPIQFFTKNVRNNPANNKDRYYHTKELFRYCNILNVYKLNLLNNSIFMPKTKTGIGSSAFLTIFKVSFYSCQTHFSIINYSIPQTRLRISRFWISVRGPAILNNFATYTEKKLQSSSLFKSKLKTKLLDFEKKGT